MGPLTAVLGIAAGLGVLVASNRRRRRPIDDLVGAYILVLIWIIGAFSRQIFGSWEVDGVKAYLWTGPAVDLMFMPMAVLLHRSSRAYWSLTLVSLAAFQLALHAAYGVVDKTRGSELIYKAALNLSFLAQVMCVAAPGGTHVLRSVLDRLRSGRVLSAQVARRLSR